MTATTIALQLQANRAGAQADDTSPTPFVLTPHPRLYLGGTGLARIRQPASQVYLQSAQAQIETTAERYLNETDYNVLSDGHNAHLIRARGMQTRIVTLLTRYLQTGNPKYRDAAIACVDTMGHWEYCSWIAWRASQPEPKAIFDLSYGENSATIAIAYDLLHDELTGAQRDRFVTIARERAIEPFLHHTGADRRAWWYEKKDSNWNTVCAGGAGMLALAMYEHFSQAATVVLARVEASLKPYLQHMHELDGGWPEGIGYWNYGMRYAFMYLLSHQRALGQPNPLLALNGVRRSLEFPLDFSPNGVPCGFSDGNQWHPMPFHFAIAEALDHPTVISALHNHLQRKGSATGGSPWPDAAELIWLHPRKIPVMQTATDRVARIYKGLDWAILADRLPDPAIYMAIRGGSTEVPHGHMDLMSFHCVVGDERLITSLNVSGGYLDSTFSPRRYEIFEMTPASKNTIIINGIGITKPAAVGTQLLHHGAIEGVRMDSTGQFGVARQQQPDRFSGRLALNLANDAFMIVDQVELHHNGRIESRLHSEADFTLRETSAVLQGRRQALTVTYGANIPAGLHTSVTTPTKPGPGVNVLRWCADGLVLQATLVTLLTPGTGSPKLHVQTGNNEGIRIRVANDGWQHEVDLTDRLYFGGQAKVGR